jgi:hypothetical protein
MSQRIDRILLIVSGLLDVARTISVKYATATRGWAGHSYHRPYSVVSSTFLLVTRPIKPLFRHLPISRQAPSSNLTNLEAGTICTFPNAAIYSVV